MALQYGVKLRNAQLDQIAATVGASARLEIRTGPPPEDCAAEDAGELLCELLLPPAWLSPAVNGVAAKTGELWVGTARAEGNAGHFRFKDAAGTVTHVQGTIGRAAARPDMVFDNPALVAGQTVIYDAWAFTDPNE